MPEPRVVIVALVPVLAFMLAACGGKADQPTRSSTSVTTIPSAPTAIRGTPSPIDNVLPGQCFNQVPDAAQRPFAVLVLGCEEAHSFEIFDRFSYTEAGRPASSGTAYPGETTVRTAAEQGCYDRFETWMGIPWTQSTYDIQSWWPSAASWRRNDRVVTCAAFRFDGKSTSGSVRATKK